MAEGTHCSIGWAWRPRIARPAAAARRTSSATSKPYGYLLDDDLPKLGDEESSFCFLRAAAHEVITGDKKGKKKAPRTRKKGESMDELGYVNITQSMAEAILESMQAKWAKRAVSIWKKCKEQHPELKKYDVAVDYLFLKKRTALQLEALLCEVGSRQRKAEAHAAGHEKKGTKSYWKPRLPRKDLSKVTVLYLGADGKVKVVRNVNLLKSEVS